MSTLLLSLLLACGGDASAVPDCSRLDQAAQRDACLAERIAAQPPEQAAQVLEQAQAIQDPMLRGAAVSRWVEGHAGDLPTDQGQALCALLTPPDQAYCSRRLSSPHLQ